MYYTDIILSYYQDTKQYLSQAKSVHIHTLIQDNVDQDIIQALIACHNASDIIESLDLSIEEINKGYKDLDMIMRKLNSGLYRDDVFLIDLFEDMGDGALFITEVRVMDNRKVIVYLMEKGDIK